MNEILLPNGCHLYWISDNNGGRTYSSDEVGGDVFVWNTSLVDKTTLLAAIVQEETLLKQEKFKK